MFGNDCLECGKSSKLIEEKEKKLSVYQNNLYEMKSKMIETSNLINVYFNYKNENESLRKEMEAMKKNAEGSVSTVHNAKINYEIELLRNKYLKECERTKSLEVANTQLSALIDELKKDQDGSMRTENIKLRKEISEKERHINSLNSTVAKLKSELNDERIKVIDSNRFIKHTVEMENDNQDSNIFDLNYENVIELPKTKNMTHNNEPDFDLFENKNKSKKENTTFTINPNQLPMPNLIKENEYLQRKFQKYQMKYIKFKYKYKTLRSITKLPFFHPPESVYNNNPTNFLNQKKKRSENEIKNVDQSKNINVSARKNILSRKNSVFSNSELFDTRNNYMFENSNIETNKISEYVIVEKDQDIGKEEKDESSDVTIESEPEDKKSKKKKNKKIKGKNTEKITKSQKIIKSPKPPRKKKVQKIFEDELESEEKDEIGENQEIFQDIDDEESEKVEKNTKLKTKKQKNLEKNIKIEKVKKNKSPFKKEIVPHIGPIKKFKTNDALNLQKEKDEFRTNFIEYINNIIFEEEIVKEYINKFELDSTIHEKIYKILEIIIESSEKLDFMNILYFIKIFIITLNDSKILNNFNEYMLANYEIILWRRDANFFSNNSEINDTIKIHKIFNQEINLSNEYLKVPYLISYISALFYINLPIQPENLIFIFELFDRLNENTKSILILFRKLTKKSNAEFHLNYEKEIENYNKNFNKIYLLNSYKNKIITNSIFSFILSIIDLFEENKDGTEFILNTLTIKIEELDSEVELKEINLDKINFAGDIRYLEVLQIIYLCFVIKDPDWVFTNIFQNILWNQFLNTKEESLKRVGILFYISFVFSYLVSKDAKFEKQNTKDIMGWIISIINPTFKDQKITLYDRVGVLSFFIDNFIYFDINITELTKFNITNLLSTSNIENFPEDFIEKIKKMNLLP